MCRLDQFAVSLPKRKSIDVVQDEAGQAQQLHKLILGKKKNRDTVMKAVPSILHHASAIEKRAVSWV